MITNVPFYACQITLYSDLIIQTLSEVYYIYLSIICLQTFSGPPFKLFKPRYPCSRLHQHPSKKPPRWFSNKSKKKKAYIILLYACTSEQIK